MAKVLVKGGFFAAIAVTLFFNIGIGISMAVFGPNLFFNLLVFASSLFVILAVFYKVYKAEKLKSDKVKKYNQTEYVNLLESWQGRFYCHKCSNVFTPATLVL